MTDLLRDLLLESRQLGFLGPGPVEDHLGHARAFAVLPQRAPDLALDLGAGGGLPGLVLAATTWPDARWVFLDAHQRRTQFLTEAVDALGLAYRVEVVRARAEEFGREEGRRGAFDLVVARSFGAPAVTAECAAPLLRVGGELLVSEPPEATTSERWPRDGLAELGLGGPERQVVDASGVPVHLVRLVLEEACGERYPRRVGVPSKRPLF
ncbi:MAG: class I SAM-dependent methyltransferase [Acidimicrobiales bacterium]|nr:class I SAM-dependent methyltransferase [Acidimicrobiales bacterium]